MTPSLDPDHPLRTLLFFVDQDIDDSIRARTKEFVERLSQIKQWTNGPPCFVNMWQEFEDEAPIETLGAYIEIHSALPPWIVPREIALQELQDVEVLVASVCQFSRDNDVLVTFELDQEQIGEIDRGVIDPVSSDMLIGDWRRGLGLDA